MSILRWHSSTVPGFGTKKEPTAYDVLDELVGDPRRF
jgi:hypothetical protein